MAKKIQSARYTVHQPAHRPLQVYKIYCCHTHSVGGALAALTHKSKDDRSKNNNHKSDTQIHFLCDTCKWTAQRRCWWPNKPVAKTPNVAAKRLCLVVICISHKMLLQITASSVHTVKRRSTHWFEAIFPIDAYAFQFRTFSTALV